MLTWIILIAETVHGMPTMVTTIRESLLQDGNCTLLFYQPSGFNTSTYESIFENQVQILLSQLDYKIDPETMPMTFATHSRPVFTIYYALAPSLRFHKFVESVSGKPLCMVLATVSIRDMKKPRREFLESWHGNTVSMLYI